MKNIFKKSISIFLTLLILISIAPTSVVTYAGDIDNTGDGINWTFDGETLVVSGSGELSSTYTSTEEWKNMKDKCVNVTIEGEIKIIGKKAFKDFTAIKKLEVTSPLITVDEYAFSGCTALEEITLPDTLLTIEQYAFADCSAVKAFEFPSKLREISAWAFKNFTCFDGKPLVLPDSLKKVSLGSFHGADITSLTAPLVGYGIFGDMEDSKGGYNIGTMFGDVSFPNSYGCYDSSERDWFYVPNSLKEVTITKELYFGNFENVSKIEKIVIKDTVETTYIPSDFVKNCTSLKELIIENADIITSIGSSAFEECSLESFTIPENVTTIYSRAFYHCMFNSIIIPEKVEKIDTYAFYGCVNIQSLIIPDSVTYIGDYAFKDCKNLGNVKLPNNASYIGKGVFENTQYTGEIADEFVITENGVLIEYYGTNPNVIVPEGVKRIGSAFRGRSDIKSIILPDGLLYISQKSFDGCSGLTELIIPDTVLVIETYAFHDCSNIKELVIPDSVVEIQEAAFAGICKLEKLTVPFIGESRDAESDTRESLLCHFFGTANDHKCVYNCYGFYDEIKQTWQDGYYGWRVCKPCYFTELVVTDSVIKKGALSNFELKSLTLGENVDGIEEYAADKSGIEELYIDPNIKITEIPDYAFSNNNLTSVNIPGSVKRIGKAFTSNKYADNKITEINLNEGLEVIDGSFKYSKITSIDFPDSLKRILNGAFENCTNLEYVEFPENVTRIGRHAFCMAGLKEVVFSEGIEEIYPSAFFECPLVKIVIPESLKSIVETTFGYCENLEIVVIGGNVTEIGSNAFVNCTSLETIVIPDSVISISDDAFKNASENMVIYCNEGSYAQEYAIQNNIKYTTLVLDAIPNQTYTGKAIEPVVKAKANNRQLVLNTEYKLSYSDNINVGVAGVTAKGLGDFKHLVAKGKFNILARQLSNVTVNYQDFAIYSPNGIEPEISIYVGNELLSEGVDYEILGLDKINGVGTYNIAIKGKGNLIGTQNFTIDVLPRNINEIRVITIGGLKITDSGYTLVEGVDYKVEERTKADGDKETYVVGMGNYTDEKRISTSESSSETNILLKIFELIKNFFAKLFGVFE